MAIEVYRHDPIIDPSADALVLYSTNNPGNYNCIPGLIKSEVNKAGSFEFDIYINDNINSIYVPTARRDYISVEDTTKERNDADRYLFYGRIIQVEHDMSGKCHCQCEGLLAELLDYIMYMPTDNAGGANSEYGIWRVRTKNTQYLFQYALDAYKEMKVANHNYYDISRGTVDASNIMQNDDDEGWFDYKFPWNRSVGEFISSELINVYGGILRMSHYFAYDNNGYPRILAQLHWDADPATSPEVYADQIGQDIIYGDNAIDARYETIDIDSPTGVFAVGRDKDDSEMRLWLQDGKNDYNHYYPHILWGTNVPYNHIAKAVDFENAHSARTANQQAQRYVNIYCGGAKKKVTAKVIDKWDYGRGTEARIKLLKRYYVDIPFPGNHIQEHMYCLSSEVDITNPANCTYVFGPYVPPETLKSMYISSGFNSKSKSKSK